MIGDETVISLQRAKVYVFSDSVLCLGRVHQHPQSNEAWTDRIGWITTSQSYRDFDGISGEPTEFEWNIFQGFTTLQLCGKVTDLLSRLGETPETFTGRNLFMSMFNDISCDKKGNEEECLADAKVVSIFAKKFRMGQWSFIGPGSEKKWYSMEENSPQGIWDHIAEKMLLELAESTCPIFRVTTPLSRGKLKSKGHGKLSIHCCADQATIETVFRIIVSTNQLSLYGGAPFPFVRMFYGSPSEYLWEHDEGTVHRIQQGEGGERGDALMPGGIHSRMNPGEFLMAFHDNVYGNSACTGGAHARSGASRTVCARMHQGAKTNVWNQAGVRPVACNAMERIARTNNPEAVVWMGSTIPTVEQGIKVLGTPIGHQDFVAAQLESVRREHEVLLNRIPSINDVQSAWLLLVHCASARACYYLRALRPSVVEEFARAHDAGLWRCLDLHKCSVEVQVAAHWASWADCLPIIHAAATCLGQTALGQPVEPV